MSKGVATVAQVGECDEIIDVRSPAEFAEDAIPGAINCPVLDDDERALFATLLAPGVAQAYAPDDEDEVVGFGSAWLPQRLPEHLARVIRDHDVRISGI